MCETTYGKDSIPDETFCIFRNGYGPCVGDTGSAAAANGTLFGKNITIKIYMYV